MALVTNTLASQFEDENEAIQAARKAQLDAANTARITAGEVPDTSQDPTDTITAYDAQTGAQFSVPVGTVGGGSGDLVSVNNLADVADPVVAAENLGIFAAGTLSNPRILAPVKWYWGALNASIVGTELNDPYTSTNGGTVSAVDGSGPLSGAIPTPLEYVTAGVSNINNTTIVPLGSAANVSAGVQVGDRVFYNDSVNYGHQGIYTVTVLGNVSTPWKIVRAVDHPVSQLLQAFKVGVEGTNIVIQSTVNETDPQYIRPSISAGGLLAVGRNALATGVKSVALGDLTKATGVSSFALGNQAVVAVDGSIQIGLGSNEVADSVRVSDANIQYDITPVSVVAGEANFPMTQGNLWYVGISSAVSIFVSGVDGNDVKICITVASGGPHALTFPAGWVWTSSVPATLAAGKTAVLSVTRFQTLYIASWAVQA